MAVETAIDSIEERYHISASLMNDKAVEYARRYIKMLIQTQAMRLMCVSLSWIFNEGMKKQLTK